MGAFTLYKSLAVLIESKTDKKDIRNLINIINSVISFDDLILLLFQRNQPPSFLAFDQAKAPNAEYLQNKNALDSDVRGDFALNSYFNGAYLIDPYYELWKSDPVDGFYQLRDVTSSEFKSSKYFQTHYKYWNLIDEGTYFVKVDSEFSLQASLGRYSGKQKFSKKESKILQEMLPLVRAIVLKNFQDTKPQTRQASRSVPKFHQQLETRFLAFGTSILTDRETEIIRLMIKGYSVKSIGRLEEISPATVATHKKSIYRKLEIQSYPELFGLFMEALWGDAQNETIDPLPGVTKPRPDSK